jgi:signal transduction histidine kinase/CheY-like chemotaxis protein
MSKTGDPNGARRFSGTALIPLGIGVLALAATWLSVSLTRINGGLTAIWPVNAIIIAAMMKTQKRRWPLVLGFGVGGNFFGNLLIGNSLFLSSGLSACNLVEITVCSFALWGQMRNGSDFYRRRDFWQFAFICIICSLFSSLICLGLFRYPENSDIFSVLLRWMFADCLGLLVLIPVFMQFSGPSLRLAIAGTRRWRALIMIAGFAAMNAVVFSQPRYPPLVFIPAALLVLVFELGELGAAIGLLITSVIGVGSATMGVGPVALSPGDHTDGAFALQALLSVSAIVSLTVAATLTQARRFQDELFRKQGEAEAANLAKSTFLATMSHEIRTPLNGVLGMAQAMAMGDLSLAQRERLDVIRRSGEALLVILNDVLDLSKIEAGKLDLESAEFDIEDLASSVRDVFAPAAEAKDCRFVLAVEPAAAGIYRGDPTRIRQILCNLVSNALKFTEGGEVRLAIAAASTGLELQVKDSGIGMSDEQIAGLFRKFEQADASTTRRFGGTGLGLAICRELAALMGGSIGAVSRLGEGSTFTVTLPLPRLRDADAGSKTEPEPDVAPMSPQPALRVLAAEDNAVNQLVLKALLQPIGVEPRIVNDGVDAVAAWEAEDWDVILMDVQMPRMDGPAATRLIRERERASGCARTPIIALTANAMSHQVDDYLAAGMDGFVPKPMEASRLFAAIEAVLRPRSDVDQTVARGAA